MHSKLILSVHSASGVTIHVFEQPLLLIGRHEDGDLVFAARAAPGVSSKHALLGVDGARVRLRDLGSTNGTYVNGLRIHRSVTLRPRDVVRLGQHGPTFRVALDPKGDSSSLQA